MKAFSYLRVSGKGQVEGDGFPRQRVAISARAKFLGAEIVQEFTDEGISGASDLEDRPALIALFSAIEGNGVRTVIVERADRLARDVMVSEVLLAKFRKLGVVVIDAESGADLTTNDPDNPTGTLIRQILAVIAQFEKTSIVAKLKKARNRKRIEIGRCEGQKPYGFLPGEDDVIRLMRSLRRKPIVQGKRMSYKKIADELTNRGIKSRQGRNWSMSSVKTILLRK